MELNQFENALVVFMFEVMKVNGSVEYYEYEGGYKAATLLVGDEKDPLHLIFSFPNESDDCYLMLSDGNPRELAKLMASLQEYNEGEAHLCTGHTVPSESKYMEESGWAAFLLSSPQITYSSFPELNIFSGRKIMFHMAIPITEEERELKISSGLDALIDEFEEKERDVVTF